MALCNLARLEPRRRVGGIPAPYDVVLMTHIPPAPTEAAEIFGRSLPHAREYAAWLAGAGVERGLIGPREVGRLWERHLLNCAVVAEAVGRGVELVDIGSGAGLPGIVLAIVRPDIVVTLVEPLQRRYLFLVECVEGLGLDRVRVVHGRAEDLVGEIVADVATARAVAPLGRLAGWALPLLRPGGELLALKGERAMAEIEEAGELLSSLGADGTEVIHLGSGKVDPPTTVVRVVAGRSRRPSQSGGRRRGTVRGRKG